MRTVKVRILPPQPNLLDNYIDSGRRFPKLFWYASALVFYDQRDFLGRPIDLHQCCGTLGMSVNIGERFLDDSENRQRQIARQVFREFADATDVTWCEFR
ncbi:MAG: hypothetical protein QOJ41_2363 [Acidobacteriaceae bacterium]|nr:hypothetical protein [Acidobacteriaceae bacterium]